MKYTICTEEKWEVYERNAYVVEANSPKEAVESYQNGDYDDQYNENMDYGDCIYSDIDEVEDESGNEVTDDALKDEEL